MVEYAACIHPRKTMIHATALVHRSAQVGANVTVGPHAIIDRFAQIGDDCTIQAHAVIGKCVVIGQNNLIGYGAVIGGDPQHTGFHPGISSAVRIGDGNTIREYCTIHRGSTDGSVTTIADNCFLMAGAHLGHDGFLRNNVVLADNVLLGGYVCVDDHAFIAEGCAFHQHVRVGRLSFCRHGGRFFKDVPPFTVAAETNGIVGVNWAGLRRAGLLADQCTEIDQAFSLLFRSGRNVTQAIAASRERIWGPEARTFFNFVAGPKKRGICSFLTERQEDSEWESYGDQESEGSCL